MTITSRVKDELFETNEFRPIRIAPSVVPPQSIDDDLPAIRSRGTPWSAEEHEKFLDALAQYPYGPWRMIAEHIGTRTARQAMSHAQKYRQKIKRRKRDVIKQKEAQRKTQNNAARATVVVAAVTPGPPRTTTAVVSTASNDSSVRAPLSSRYELPSLQVPDMQAVVDASELPFGGYACPERGYYDYAQFTHSAAPEMNAIHIPTPMGSYDPQAQTLDWSSYYYYNLPPRYAASTNANAATGHGNDHTGYFI